MKNIFLKLEKQLNSKNMNTSKIIGIILIVISLAVGYIGINKIADNTKEINLLGLKIDASNESGKEKGYLYLGLAVILLAGGVYTVNKSK
ncbi:hypothetical protein [Flavobacterium sp.]|uniref:hypothetical protein n=1 Tax=Flavobacterium sp. TaxID=239 RepID=UPI003267634D